MQEHVGQRAGPFEDQVNRERVRAFLGAVGARDRGVAPPTFMTICRRGEFEILTRMGIPLARVLHGEQEYQYTGDVRVGDTLRYETELVQVTAKAAMHFLLFETRVNANDRESGLCRTTIIVREEKAKA